MLLVNCLEAWKLGSQKAEVMGILKYFIDKSLLSFQSLSFLDILLHSPRSHEIRPAPDQ